MKAWWLMSMEESQASFLEITLFCMLQEYGGEVWEVWT